MSNHPVHLPHKSWLVVFDGAKALILRNMGHEQAPQLELVEAMQHRSPPSHELGRDRPGRVHQSYGPARSAVEEPDLHLAAQLSFVKEVSAMVEKSVHGHAVLKLVLVAPPKLLGELRRCLTRPMRALIVAEIGKDLTKLPIPEIERHFAR